MTKFITDNLLLVQKHANLNMKVARLLIESSSRQTEDHMKQAYKLALVSAEKQISQSDQFVEAMRIKAKQALRLGLQEKFFAEHMKDIIRKFDARMAELRNTIKLKFSTGLELKHKISLLSAGTDTLIR